MSPPSLRPYSPSVTSFSSRFQVKTRPSYTGCKVSMRTVARAIGRPRAKARSQKPASVAVSECPASPAWVIQTAISVNCELSILSPHHSEHIHGHRLIAFLHGRHCIHVSDHAVLSPPCAGRLVCSIGSSLLIDNKQCPNRFYLPNVRPKKINSC